MSTRSPTNAEIIRKAIKAALRDMRSSMPARVTRYDAATQKADCKPTIQVPYFDEQGARQVASLPVICNVPVALMQGGGGALKMPIKADTAGATDGDFCWLVFSDVSLDKWLSGAGQEVDPQFDHSHALTDALAIVGLRPFGAPLGAAPDGKITLGFESGLTIYMSKDSINIGTDDPSNYEAAARAPLVKTELDAVKTEVDQIKVDLDALKSFCSDQATYDSSHTHQVATTGSPVAQSGTAAPSTTTAPSAPNITLSPHTPSEVASSKVNVEK